MHVTCNVTKVYEHNGRASRCMPDITAVHYTASDFAQATVAVDETVERRVTFVPSEVFISSSGFIRLDQGLRTVKAPNRDRYETSAISI